MASDCSKTPETWWSAEIATTSHLSASASRSDPCPSTEAPKRSSSSASPSSIATVSGSASHASQPGGMTAPNKKHSSGDPNALDGNKPVTPSSLTSTSLQELDLAHPTANPSSSPTRSGSSSPFLSRSPSPPVCLTLVPRPEPRKRPGALHKPRASRFMDGLEEMQRSMEKRHAERPKPSLHGLEELYRDLQKRRVERGEPTLPFFDDMQRYLQARRTERERAEAALQAPLPCQRDPNDVTALSGSSSATVPPSSSSALPSSSNAARNGSPHSQASGSQSPNRESSLSEHTDTSRLETEIGRSAGAL